MKLTEEQKAENKRLRKEKRKAEKRQKKIMTEVCQKPVKKS